VQRGFHRRAVLRLRKIDKRLVRKFRFLQFHFRGRHSASPLSIPTSKFTARRHSPPTKRRRPVARHFGSNFFLKSHHTNNPKELFFLKLSSLELPVPPALIRNPLNMSLPDIGPVAVPLGEPVARLKCFEAFEDKPHQVEAGVWECSPGVWKRQVL